MSVAPSVVEESKPVVHMSGVHTGNIVSNRKLMPPVVDPSAIEHESYVPFEFAQAKVEEVSIDLNRMKVGYDHYICKMKSFYESQDKETKGHYENYILDLKKKALKHLEIERKKAKKREEELQAALALKDDEMEELRELTAGRISEFQAKIHHLKKQHEDDGNARHECDLILKEMLGSIEKETIDRISNGLTEKYSSEMLKKESELSSKTNDFQETLQRLKADNAKLEDEIAKEKDALNKAEKSRAQKSAEATAVTKESQVFLGDLLHQLQMKKQQLLVKKQSKEVKSLKKLNAENEAKAARLAEDLKTEKQRAAAAVQEQIEKYNALLRDQDSAAASRKQLEESTRSKDCLLDVKATVESIVGKVEMRHRLEQERAKVESLNKMIAELKQQVVNAEAQQKVAPAQLQPQSASNPPPVAEKAVEKQPQQDEERQRIMEEIEKLRERIESLQYEVESDEESLAEKTKEKADTKNAIKKWMKDFEAENGRPPNNDEKSSVRDMFLAHKAAGKQVDSITEGIASKKAEVSSLEETLAELEKSLEALPSTSSTDEGGGQVDSQRVSELEKRLQAVEAEKKSALKLVETIRAEKRTDVIARFEKEMDELRRSLQDMENSAAASKTERSKLEAKVKELSDRADTAEQELKERDERDAKKADSSEELLELQNQVARQRNDIISKSKAATAGWDAAAETEEKYEVDVRKAYQRGLEEGRRSGQKNQEALTKEVEEKESRIAELLQSVAEAEQRAADQSAGKPPRAYDSDDDDDDDDEGNGNSAMVKELQADLEASQDEVASLCNQVESLKKSLDIADQKGKVLEKLLAQSQSDAANASAAKSGPVANIEELVGKVKHATDEGTKLWKENKKDECCELYETVAKEISTSNCQQNLLDTLTSALDSAHGQSKRRGAVILRKGLDNFLAEAEKIHSSLSSALSKDDAGGKESQEALLKELKALQEQSEAQKSAESRSGDTEAGAANAALIKRAKAAEEKVKALQKELTAAKKAAPRGKAPSGGSGKGSAEDAKEIKSLQKQIKDLEKQLSSGGGGGGGAKEKIALANQEKKFKKEIKEMETSHRKEKAAIEKDLSATKSELEKVTEKCNAATEERDKLRIRVDELGNANAEMEALREKADKLDEMAETVKTMKKEVTSLTAQYKKEANLRKKYKNELEDLKGAIRVYARVRPMAKYEIEKDCKSVVEFPDETSVTVHTSRGVKEFEFDSAFRDTSTQEEVFEDTKRLVESMIDGFNVCLFAYGQTGSGKTFTMTGSSELPGLTPRAIEEMFRLISEKKNCTCRVSTYFVELYNDNVVDLYWLLDNKKGKKSDPPKLDIKLDAKKMVFIKNSVIKSAESADELMELFHKGNQERHVGATKMNAESSRSHSIFAIMCESYDATTKKTTIGKLSLVDLAGSERADKTGASADRLREAQSINKSLSALGDVISALSEGEKFIPYRNNKLTQLMQDSLGGNAKTLMFVNFSPADYNCDETVTSLSYATRVKKITNNASKQAESEEIARLKAMIKKLQAGQSIDDGEEETKD